MTLFDIIFVADVLFLILAAILFLAGRKTAEPTAGKLLLLSKILAVMAFITYTFTEIFIGKGGNLLRGFALFGIGIAIYYFFFRKRID